MQQDFVLDSLSNNLNTMHTFITVGRGWNLIEQFIDQFSSR